MAKLRGILGTLWTATRRNSKTLTSFSGNNLYYAGFALLFVGDPIALAFFLVIMGLVLIFPLSSDPLRRIPPDRLALWPLTNSERRLLRVLSPWLNPLTWLVAVFLVWKRISLGLWALMLGILATGFAAPALIRTTDLNVLRRLPNFPGPLNQLVRKNIRELLSTLDFYAGLVIAAAALVFRLRGLLPRAALVPVALLIVLTLSTCALSLFGLDGEDGLTRYRLLPIAGWKVLASKDVPFVLIAVILTLPFSALTGLAASLAALTAGHAALVQNIAQNREQNRWRFQTSSSFGESLIQIIAMMAAGGATAYASPLFLAVCILGYGASTWWFGRHLTWLAD